MSKSKIPDSETEYRFIFYTTNLLLLALAALPLLILRWTTRASKMLNKKVIRKDKEGNITERSVTLTWISGQLVLQSYPLITKKLGSIPAGFSPFALGMWAHTVLKPYDKLEFTRLSIDPKDYPDDPWKETRKIKKLISNLKKVVTKKQEKTTQLQKKKIRLSQKPKEIRKIDKRISRLKEGITKIQDEIAQRQETLRKLQEKDQYLPSIQDKLWDFGKSMITSPKIKAWWPKRRTRTVFVLESVNGSKAKARDYHYVWDLFDEMVRYGGPLAQTPICEVITRTQEDVQKWIMRKAEREEIRFEPKEDARQGEAEKGKIGGESKSQTQKILASS